MNDLISRQAAIEINRSYHGQMPNEVNHRIWKEINDLPSAQPERKKGEWIYAKEQLEIVPMWECSCCRIRVPKKFNFCPNCGADMKVESQKEKC